MSSFVSIEKPFEFILRTVKTKGLRPNSFNGKRVPGHQISVQVQGDDIEKIQDVWDLLNAKKSTPFFIFNGNRNMITVKAKKVSDSLKRDCVSKDENIYVDIKFEIADVYVDENGARFPQLRLKGLRKVESPEDEFVVTDEMF